MRTRQSFRSVALIAAAAMGTLQVSRSLAQVSGTWIGDSGTWTDVSRWTSNPQFPNSGGVATFGGGVFEHWSIVTVNTPVTLSRITFGNSNLLPTLMGNGANMITLAGPAEVSVARGRSRTFNLAYADEGPRIEGLAGSAGLHKLGAGTLLLGGTNTFSGDVRVSAGVLEYVSNSALGAASNRIILDGGTLQEYGSSGTISRDMVLGPGGGTLLAVSTVTYAGTISGSGSLTYDPIATTSRSVLQGANTYTGATVVSGFGRLVVSGNGSIRNSSQLIARNGALTIANGTIALSNRLPNTPVVLQGGILQISGNSSAVVSEQVGTITAMGNASILVPSPGAAQTNLTAIALVRSGRSVAQFLTAPGISHVTFANPPTLIGGAGAADTPNVSILPWSVINANGGTSSNTVSPFTFATHDANGIRALTSSEFANSLPSGTSTQNVLLSSDAIVSTPTTINALRFAAPSNGTVSLDGAATLTIASGAMMLDAATVNAPINFGNVEGIITANRPSTLNGAISGTEGLTIADGVTLGGQSTYSGPTTILPLNSSRVVITIGDILPGVSGPLGNDTSAIEIHTNTALEPRPASGNVVTVGRDLHFIANTSKLVFGIGPRITSGTNSLNVTGNVSGDGAIVLNGTITIAGNVSGPLTLFPTQSSLTLTANNNFSGGIEVSSTATILTGSNTALGTGMIGMAGGTLGAVGGARTLANPLTIWERGNFAGSNPLTFTGTTELAGGGTVSVHDPAGHVTLSNLAAGGFYLGKSGAGRLAVNRLQLPSVNVSAGTLEVLADGVATSASNYVGTLMLAGAVSQPTATLDLTNTDLLLTNTPLPTARAAMVWARHDGAWDRPGLTSSTAAAHPVHATTLGLLSGAEYKLGNSSTFGTLPVNDADVLVKYTYYGDTDLNGLINFDDYARIDSGFNNNRTGWFNGDFDYSGTVNFDDYALIDLAFNTQTGPLVRAVPEAGVAGVLGMAAAPLLVRSRRRGR